MLISFQLFQPQLLHLPLPLNKAPEGGGSNGVPPRFIYLATPVSPSVPRVLLHHTLFLTLARCTALITAHCKGSLLKNTSSKY